MLVSPWKLLASMLVTLCVLHSTNGNDSYKKRILQRFISALSRNTMAINVSAPCLRQIMSSSVQINLGKYIDSMGKPGSGLSLGNVYWPGSYEECLSIPDSHYCLSSVDISPVQVTAVVGLCTPSMCNSVDIASLFNYGMKVLNVSKYVHIPKIGHIIPKDGTNVICPTKISYGTGKVVTLVLCAILLLLCILGTFVEVLWGIFKTNRAKLIVGKMENQTQQELSTSDSLSSLSEDELSNDTEKILKHCVLPEEKRKSSVTRVLDALMCFSLIKNTKAVLNTDTPDNAVGCLHGIRVLSMWWVLLGHVQGFAAQLYVSDNIAVAPKILRRFTFLPVANGYFAVDSFFVLGGMLVSYLGLRRYETKGKLPLLAFYVHRFLRLTPVYMFIILFVTNLFPLLADGPIWTLLVKGPLLEACRKNWWTNLLYINNFYPKQSETCIGWTWYLANDMQFYIISPIFLYIMYRFRIIGTLVSVGVTLVSSFVATAVLISYYNFDPFMSDLGTGPNKVHFMDYVYVKPYCRISPYLVGLVLGYVLHKRMKLRGQFKWVAALLGWSLAVALGLMVVYGTWPNFKDGKPVFGMGVNISYGTFSRFVWGVALAWLIYACFFGFGGLVNKLLSWRAFVPLSRLTYGVYMVHLIVIEFIYYSQGKPMHYSDINMALMFMAVVVSSYAIAFVLAICVEIPFFNLEKLVFKL